MCTADVEKGVKAGKAGMWHSQVLGVHLMTVRVKVVNCVCNKRVTVTLRHHLLKAAYLYKLYTNTQTTCFWLSLTIVSS